jgi:predicted transcriptional regulator
MDAQTASVSERLVTVAEESRESKLLDTGQRNNGSPFPMVASDQPVDSVVKLLSKANPAVLVQEHGVVQGIVTRSDMLHFMMSR